jgi:hypothetical protein
LKKLLPLIGISIPLMALAYLESPYSIINKDQVRIASIPNEVLLADAEADANSVETTSTEEGGEEVAQNYTLEYVLEEKSEVDGYIVETYREYEIYKDEEGKVIKKNPTSNYNYLRYYQ